MGAAHRSGVAAGKRNAASPRNGLAPALVSFHATSCRRAPILDAILRFDGGEKRDPTIEAWLKGPPNELGDLVRPWFRKMRACGEDVRELMHDGSPTVCVDDAPFAYVGIHKAHANVGFFHGVDLIDPTRLLEGSGKRMRHVKLKPGQAIDTAALDALIDAAYLNIKLLLRAT